MKQRLALILPFFILSSCASLSSDDSHDLDKIAINKIDTRFAKIGFVTLATSDSGLWIRGDVRRRIKGRGPTIYGHVHINVLGKDNAPLAAVSVNHKRPNRQSQRAGFAKKLDVNSADAKIINITHHSERHNHS